MGDVDLIFTEEARLTVINAAGAILPEESSVVWCSEHQVSVNRRSGLGETCLVSATFDSGVSAAELGEISILLEGLRLHDRPSSVKVRMRRTP